MNRWVQRWMDGTMERWKDGERKEEETVGRKSSGRQPLIGCTVVGAPFSLSLSLFLSRRKVTLRCYTDIILRLEHDWAAHLFTPRYHLVVETFSPPFCSALLCSSLLFSALVDSVFPFTCPTSLSSSVSSASNLSTSHPLNFSLTR